MADGFEMVLQGLAADGDPVFQNNFGFRLREAVPFKGIAGIGQADAIILLELLERLPAQWPHAVDLPLQLLCFVDAVLEIHGVRTLDSFLLCLLGPDQVCCSCFNQSLSGPSLK